MFNKKLYKNKNITWTRYWIKKMFREFDDCDREV